MMSETTDKRAEPTPGYAEGLIEYLQATAPSWATKLTMERLALVRQITQARRERDDLLAFVEDLADPMGPQAILDGGGNDTPEGQLQTIIDRARAAIAAARGRRPAAEPGDTVTIYEDPMTREKVEGQATLVRWRYTDSDLGERWEVRFDGEDGTYERWVSDREVTS